MLSRVLPTLLSAAAPCRTVPPTLSAMSTRRAAISAAAVIATRNPQHAIAGADGTWAKHKGAFEPSFFADFKASKASTDFLYKFVEPGEGETAVNFQSVTMRAARVLEPATYGGRAPHSSQDRVVRRSSP